MDALKETLLQLFIAYLPAFTFQIYLMKPARIARAYLYMGMFSIISVFLCMFFSFYYFEETSQPFDFRLIPYVIGILYGGYRLGAVIVLLYVLILFGFDLSQQVYPFWSDALMYLTPFLFLYIKRFRAADSSMRMLIVMNFALFGILLYTIFYASALWYHNIVMNSDIILFLGMFGSVFLIASCTVVYFVEVVREKAYLQQGYAALWRQYHQEARKLREVMDTTPLGVFAVDANARITNINQTMIRIIKQHSGQYVERDVIGQAFKELFHKIGMWKSDEVLVSRVLRGEPLQNEVRIVGDRTYHFHTNSMQDENTGEIVGAVGILHDITELVHLRAEMGNMERLSLVGQMAASITHEIRNPMAVVRGFMQLMKQKSAGHMDDYYNIVMEELDRANGIINDFLSLAQNRIVEKEKLHLHDLIHHILPLLWADANLRGQVIELDLQDNVPVLLLNPKEMKQLFLNLARNAMEAMDEKGVLTISTNYHEHLSIIELRVQDTGMGIPDPIKDKLFEPFYTTKTKGTGLGLALCLSIVERHDGTIRVESETGKGTVFIVSFRLQAEAATYRLQSD